ncbi:Gfo/Idh/MocA family oxidoreductase [candidate division KSB1 bacterium]|nr:Gfo/Idh/MocA family oxidoreductase [candidate division KSB1 bacterium]
MQTLKLGIIGAGFVAKFHARAIAQVRNIQIAGITSRPREGAEALAKLVRKHGLGESVVYSNIAEMANHVDAVAIFAPNFARIEIVEEIVHAVQRGANLKGIICEKPLARNMPEARRMIELVDSVSLKTAYFENQVFMKPIRAQLAQLAPQQKIMGSLLLTRSSEEHGGPHAAWFWDPTRQGGGVLSDMGCHSIAVGWYTLTPPDKPPMFLEPVSVSADCALLKWGLPQWRTQLLEKFGVDYTKTPAEDFTTGIITYRNPESGQRVKAQFTNSWMFDKQGLRLFMDGMGPGYAFEINSLNSPLQIFIGDIAAEAAANSELALEKATASRGLLSVQPNEADLYGYPDEIEDAVAAFDAGTDALLSWRYGLEITKLVMAAYLSAERQQTIDLTDPGNQKELETYVPLIQQGKGREVLYVK